MSFFGNIDFQKLTFTEKVIYNYLKNNVDKIPYLHVRDIALEAHAGSSSVMRLIHKMGFDSYIDFKEYIKGQKEAPVVEDSIFKAFLPEDYPKNIEEILEELADKIINSDNLIFTGIGASGLICDYAARRFAGIGINSFSFSDVTYPISTKLKNTAYNLVIALSISGETNEIIEVLTSLQENKDITIAAITPNVNSTIAQLSDIAISYRVDERRVNIHYDLSSQLPAVFLLESLSELVYQRSLG
ncbi:MurR/RpiR family transcriptional regulator [Lactococcus nasutitermitis]|uniref:MurR/RpiR family transcriptional regulator n=1 Tax=Lactococcus nasutitermitis TaxID=1652957 RepID=A0ABV9JF02_9LACT|nr:MurR/RpiR family transcriptional regulator [Lactococcus nasutitermitis]